MRAPSPAQRNASQSRGRSPMMGLPGPTLPLKTSQTKLLGTTDGNARMLQPNPDWEQQVEILDKQEMELHQTQMKLFREQMTNVIRDLAGLRNDVNEIRFQRGAEGVRINAVHEELRREKEDTQNELMALIAALQDDQNGHSSRLDQVAELINNDQFE